METKHDRFIRLAEQRTNGVINKLRLISNLSNSRNYDYSKTEVQEIFRAIDEEVKMLKKAFEKELHKKNEMFTFSIKKDDTNE